ncbi:MAG: beta-lactamase family protein, partial [Bacteroidetes bacterium]|nr:beta-lactamase family protein [Bacteroidota bacterium]
MKRICWLFLALIPGCLTPCLAQLNKKEAAALEKLGRQLDNDIIKDGVQGSISVAYINDKGVAWTKAFGRTSPDATEPADSTTIYRIGSITKTFTATLLMLAVENGVVRLDDPVEEYVPEVRRIKGYNPEQMITLRQLAMHRSGLPREPGVNGSNIGPADKWESKLLSCIPHMLFVKQPNTGFLYSNVGFAILGLALERAWQIPYMQLLQEKILTPLHMDDTFFIVPEEKRSRVATGIMNRNPDTVTVARQSWCGYNVPNGALYSTPADLGKIVLAWIGKTPLLSRASWQEMQKTVDGSKNYGMGLMIEQDGPDHLGHNGSIPGY